MEQVCVFNWPWQIPCKSKVLVASFVLLLCFLDSVCLYWHSAIAKCSKTALLFLILGTAICFASKLRVVHCWYLCLQTNAALLR